MIRTRKRSTIAEIRDRHGVQYAHEGAQLMGDNRYQMTVRNLGTGQLAVRADCSPRWALLDALLAAGCDRSAATKAAKNYPDW